VGQVFLGTIKGEGKIVFVKMCGGTKWWLGGLQSLSGCSGEEKKYVILPGIEPPSSSPTDRKILLLSTNYKTLDF